jgi:hypothetical protein
LWIEVEACRPVVDNDPHNLSGGIAGNMHEVVLKQCKKVRITVGRGMNENVFSSKQVVQGGVDEDLF